MTINDQFKAAKVSLVFDVANPAMPRHQEKSSGQREEAPPPGANFAFNKSGSLPHKVGLMLHETDIIVDPPYAVACHMHRALASVHFTVGASRNNRLATLVKPHEHHHARTLLGALHKVVSCTQIVQIRSRHSYQYSHVQTFHRTKASGIDQLRRWIAMVYRTRRSAESLFLITQQLPIVTCRGSRE